MGIGWMVRDWSPDETQGICTVARRRLGSTRASQRAACLGEDDANLTAIVSGTTLTKHHDPQLCLSRNLTFLSQQIMQRCDEAGSFSEEAGKTTRTFLSEPMLGLHRRLAGWMSEAGMRVHLDAAGNLIGRYEGTNAGVSVLLIGSHLDTVPNAGKYDGVLGVLVGVAAVQALGGRRLPFGIDVIAFSEEEGIRYRAPFLGSRAICGRFDPGLLDRIDSRGVTMAQAFRSFGLDPARISEAAYSAGGIGSYLEVHIEQGPVLESLDARVGVVQAIAGQSRLWALIRGRAGHAGTLPMQGRRDALAAAAELVLEIERFAQEVRELRATVGSLSVEPGAVNVVPGTVRLCVDVRHADDETRTAAVAEIRARGVKLAARRDVDFAVVEEEHHRAVPADGHLQPNARCGRRRVGTIPPPALKRCGSRCRRDGLSGALGHALCPQSRRCEPQPRGARARGRCEGRARGRGALHRYARRGRPGRKPRRLIHRTARSLVNGPLWNDTQPPAPQPCAHFA